ncbi:hypothetical protein ACIPYS_08295 [Kitasatospora sp. NPDC089913]|uniref:hypothetical protein n=1 Tax=Kitasatospora sp. NPDC089913 TaxID=3364080 RepID=UPI00381D00CB
MTTATTTPPNERPRAGADAELLTTFTDFVQPAATAGVYRFEARQVVKDEGGTLLNGTDTPIDHQVEVRAPQFVLDASSVQAVHPPPSAAGDFARTLPHVTIARPALPWERQQKWSRDIRQRAPWMAVLLFRAGELPGDPQGLGATTARPVRELVTPTDQGVLGPKLDTLPEEILASECRTIDVPLAVFNSLVPREQEMHYLAHVRDVRPKKTRSEGERLSEGRYAVVTGNRFPCEATAYSAHLVSFEGFDGKLSGDLEGHTAVRLAALWSWSFSSDPDAAFDASGVLKALVAPGRSDPEHLALRLPPSGSGGSAAVQNRLKWGFVPVAQRVLSGERTFAWYRGPATPVTAPEVPGQVGGTDCTSADHALVYDQAQGVFDVGYACAWTLGRTLALADPSYPGDVLQARRALAATRMRIDACGYAPLADDDFRTLDKGPPRLPALHDLTAVTEDLVRGTAVTTIASPQQLTKSQITEALAHDARGRLAAMPAFLDRLSLLDGVPMCYLVPDPRMLPPESLRLFRIDPAWIRALLAGAQSIGVHTSLDRDLDVHLRAAVSRLRVANGTPRAGLLIRSALVAAWPNVRITAALGTTVLRELNRLRPDTDTVLCLFDDVPDRLVLREPAEGIHFGIDADDRVNLREIRSDRPDTGATIRGAYFPARPGRTVLHYLRAGKDALPGVLDLLGKDAATGMIADFNAQLGLELTPAQFAVEMINSPIEQHLTTA